MLLRLLTIGCLILFSSITCHGLEVTFRGHSFVSTQFVTLADVADFNDTSELSKALGTQIFGPSPSPGHVATFDSRRISQQLEKKLTLPTTIVWKGASKVQVERKGIEIHSRQIIAYIDKFLALHKGDLPKARISFTPRTLPLPFILPQGEMNVEVLPSDPSILGSSRFALIFKVDGKVRKNMSVSGKIVALAPVAVATTPITKGSIIHPNHITMQTVDIANFRTPGLDSREVVGKRAKRSIKAGSVIERSKIEFPPLVKRGQLVKVLLRSGDMHLSATGIARMNGKMNEIIRVQNSSSKKLIFCQVIAPGLVEVKL